MSTANEFIAISFRARHARHSRLAFGGGGNGRGWEGPFVGQFPERKIGDPYIYLKTRTARVKFFFGREPRGVMVAILSRSGETQWRGAFEEGGLSRLREHITAVIAEAA